MSEELHVTMTRVTCSSHPPLIYTYITLSIHIEQKKKIISEHSKYILKSSMYFNYQTAFIFIALSNKTHL